MKYLGMVAIAGLMAGSMFLEAPSVPDPSGLPGFDLPRFAVCPVDEGGGRTTQLTTASTDQGPIQLTLFAGGAPAGSIEVSIGETGVNVIPVVDVAAVGTVGGLVEVPSGASAVASVVRGPNSIAAESCVSQTPSQTYLTGGVTADQRSFVVHLMNPFAGEAVVNLSVSSEVGTESHPRFASVIVPSRSSTLVDFSEITPGRERLSVVVETESGRVIAVARQSGVADAAIWNGVAPATDWLIPIPTGGVPATVLVGNPSGLDIQYQVDIYGPGGLEEAAIADVIPPGGQASIDLAGLESVARAVRVVSAGPVVAQLWSEGESALAVTTGAVEASVRWLLPGSLATGVESGRIVILNPGLEDARVTIRSLRQASSQRTLSVPAESVVELVLEAADGFSIESNAPVVALLAATGSAGGALSMGVPISDG